MTANNLALVHNFPDTDANDSDGYSQNTCEKLETPPDIML